MSAAPDIRREFDFQEKDFHFLSRLVHDKTGIVLAEHKQNMVYSRIARRLRALGLTKFSQYCELITSEHGEQEVADFVNAVTTNLTKFFREEHHFLHLKNEVLAPAAARAGGKFRIWSAGCSSGMEPYSIAMTAREAIRDIDRWDFRILATDIDTNMLDTGRRGIYRDSDLESVPKPLRAKYCGRAVGGDEGRVEMAESLKRLIAFKQLNLLDEFPMKGPFDAVFCRNVVIYFNKDTQRVLFSKVAKLLKPGGFLYIGHSENLHGVSDAFELQGRTVYRRKG